MLSQTGLILRSSAKRRVSKDEAAPILRDAAFRPLLRMRAELASSFRGAPKVRTRNPAENVERLAGFRVRALMRASRNDCRNYLGPMPICFCHSFSMTARRLG